jgi:hypothetical protein
MPARAIAAARANRQAFASGTGQTSPAPCACINARAQIIGPDARAKACAQACLARNANLRAQILGAIAIGRTRPTHNGQHHTARANARKEPILLHVASTCLTEAMAENRPRPLEYQEEYRKHGFKRG